MANIRRSPIWPNPRVKPPFGAAQINWGHPLAQGLTAVVLLNEGAGRPYNLLTGQIATFTNTPTWGISPAGILLASDATNDRWDLGPSDAVGPSGPLIGTTSATMAVIRKKRDATNRDSVLCGVTLTLGADQVYRCQTHCPWGDGVVYFDFGGYGGANRISASGLSFSGQQAWVFVAGTRGSVFYQNGILRASQTTAITRTSSANVFTVNPTPGDATLGDLDDISLVILSQREWTQAEVLWWQAEPYAFLQPVIRRRWFVPTAAGAPTGGVVTPRSLGLLGVGA